MRGVAKSFLVAIVVAASIMVFTNLVFFFPWYMTLVIETFNLSQVAAGDNYIKQSYYDDALKRLKERPIYREHPNQIEVEALNEDNGRAVGNDDETVYANATELEKPYRQRGEPVTVTVRAVYPLSVKLWGEEIRTEIPVSFSLTSVGLKHYKDLDYYFD
ncbi:hypothetical protein [Paenibacillus sp. FSL R7-0337]|uniref:hypothetical protein n=1 Tax=unclassified Paenibacillus TaxID=185978 RepID=UPI00096E0F2D|nr:hypothetical protein [Paenibacillus sp. FSL R7-0337]OMF94244.1 hypothetical protein BK147_17035 [Paenibacillus sp. FSL R7-0337]